LQENELYVIMNRTTLVNSHVVEHAPAWKLEEDFPWEF